MSEETKRPIPIPGDSLGGFLLPGIQTNTEYRTITFLGIDNPASENVKTAKYIIGPYLVCVSVLFTGWRTMYAEPLDHDHSYLFPRIYFGGRDTGYALEGPERIMPKDAETVAKNILAAGAIAEYLNKNLDQLAAPVDVVKKN